jgi:hypothetical protein
MDAQNRIFTVIFFVLVAVLFITCVVMHAPVFYFNIDNPAQSVNASFGVFATVIFSYVLFYSIYSTIGALILTIMLFAMWSGANSGENIG